MEPVHVPVLPVETLGLVIPSRSDGILVDCTLGEGGHSELFLEKYPALQVIGIDADPEMQGRAKERLSRFGDRVRYWNGHFDDFFERDVLEGKAASAVLFDFGISMFHYTGSRRGFSLQRDERLDMRLDERTGRPASEIVNRDGEREIARMIAEYGEERYAFRIARAIVAARRQGPIESSARLADIVYHAVPPAVRYGQFHPATRTFQAFRIAVNDELGRIERALPLACEALDDGGRVGAISFHSLEDRIAKRCFRELATRQDSVPGFGAPILEKERSWDLEILTKKPVEAGDGERNSNPASRSAKLRVARKRARKT